MSSKVKRKAAKRYIETAAPAAPVALALAGIYLRISYNAVARLKRQGVLDVAADVPGAKPGAVFVTCGSCVQYRWRQLARTPSAPEHLHRDLLPVPQVKAAGTPIEQADDDDLLTLDEVAAALGCTLGRAQELVRSQALPAQVARSAGGDPEWLCRAADVRAYQQWRDRDLSAGRALSRG